MNNPQAPPPQRVRFRELKRAGNRQRMSDPTNDMLSKAVFGVQVLRQQEAAPRRNDPISDAVMLAALRLATDGGRHFEALAREVEQIEFELFDVMPRLGSHDPGDPGEIGDGTPAAGV
jgi:hypothetical protein